MQIKNYWMYIIYVLICFNTHSTQRSRQRKEKPTHACTFMYANVPTHTHTHTQIYKVDTCL